MKTSPKALSDLLMLQASFCRCPSTCDLFSLSLHGTLSSYISLISEASSSDEAWARNMRMACLELEQPWEHGCMENMQNVVKSIVIAISYPIR